MSKAVFHQKENEELRRWFVSVVHDSRWQQVLLYARSQFVETHRDGLLLAGALAYDQILSNLPEADETGTQDVLSVVKPGITHQDPTPRHQRKLKQG